MESSVVPSIDSAIGAAVTQVTGSFSAITGWWVIGVAVAFFGASIAVSVVVSLFGKKRRRRK